MIFAFSSSSAWASVALFSPDGRLAWSGQEHAPQAASEACMRLLESCVAESGTPVAAATLFLADLGPGSFTGVRVGVTLAKTLAYARAVPAGGATSFDLIDPQELVALPVKRGEYFVREPGRDPVRTSETPASGTKGYGYPGGDQFPLASGFARILGSIQPCAPEALVPAYFVEPSISTPKKPYGRPPGG